MTTLLRTLVTEGYHVTYLFSEAGRDLRRYAARLRHAGVRVTRKPGVEAWELVEGGQVGLSWWAGAGSVMPAQSAPRGLLPSVAGQSAWLMPLLLLHAHLHESA